MIKKSVINKSIVRLIILGIIILISISLVSCIQFFNKFMDEYQDIAKSFTTMVDANLDTNYIKKLINEKEKISSLIDKSTSNPESIDDMPPEIVDLYDNWLVTDNFLYNTISYNKNLVTFQIITVEEDEAICLWYESSEGKMQKKPMEHRKLDTQENLLITSMQQSEKDISTEYDPELITSIGDDKMIGTLITPILDENENIIAYTEISIDLTGIQNAILKLILTICVFMVFILAFALELYFYFSKREIIKPILQLDEATSNVVNQLQNNEDIQKLNIRTGDEIESLSHSFEAMEENLRSYIKENNEITAEREHIKAELNLASNIQADMLIKYFPPFPDRKEFNIYASMTPAKEVGGDFYDFFLIDNDHLALVIADVSGKGVPASLFMMRSMLMIESLASSTKSPAEILTTLNAMICENNDSKMFVTVWLGILNLKTGHLTASNAGHEYPIIKRPGNKFELYKDKHCFVIGGKKKIKYKEYELDLEPGTTIFVYTDGVPEAKNANEEMYTVASAIEALNKDPDANVETLTDNVKASVESFVQGAEQFDDLTILCVEYLGIE